MTADSEITGAKVKATLTAARRGDTTAAASLLLELPTSSDRRELVLIATDDPEWWAELAKLAQSAADMATQPAELALTGGRIEITRGGYSKSPMVSLPYDASDDEAYADAEAAAVDIVRLYNRHILRDRPTLAGDA